MEARLSRTLSIWATIVTMLLGILVIIGWLIGNDLLTSIIPGAVKMKFNVALSFIFSAIVLVFYHFGEKSKVQRLVTVFLCLIISLTGLLTLAEYIFGVNLGIDELFVRDGLRTTATYYAGRMSPISALNFLQIGIGLTLLNKEKAATYQFVYLFEIAFVALLMLISFNFVTDIPTFFRLAIHVAIGFITLPLAIYFAQPILQEKSNFEYLMLAGFIAVILLTLVISVYSFYYNDELTRSSRLVEYSHSVIRETDQTLSLAKDIETGARGYVIIDDSIYLEHTANAENSIFNHVIAIQKLTKDDLSQQVRVDSLSAVIIKRIEFSRKLVQLRNEKGFEAAHRMMATLKGRIYTNRIRELVGEIQQEEGDLLIQRQKKNNESISAFSIAFRTLLISLLILLMTIFFIIRYNLMKRNRAEKQGKESEEQIQTIFSAAPDAVIVMDDGGKIMKWNSMAEILFGWTTDEVLGRPLSEIIIPHRYREAHQKGLKHFLKTGEGPVLGKTIEIQAINRNNIEFEVALSISPTMVNEKHLFIGFIRDITERKKSEEELEASQKIFSTVFFKSPVMNTITDAITGKFIEVNDNFVEFSGFGKEEIIGNSSLDLNLIAQPEHWAEIVNAIKENGFTRDVLMQVRAKNGEIKWVSTSAHAVSINSRDCFLAAMIDVTERKLAEEKLLKLSQELEQKVIERTEELAKSEKLFRAMIEKDADMKTLAAPDGKILYASPSLTTILGYENHEFMTTPAFGLIHPDDVSGLIEGVTDIVQTPGKSFYRQQRLKHKNGEWIWCEGTITNMLHEPAVAALVSNFRNITERKQTEEALRENQQLLSAIINNSTAVIYVKDLDGRYLLVNHRFSELFRRSEEVMLGKTDYDFFSREDADAFRQMDERTAAADHALTEEERVPQDDGLHTYISVKSTLRHTSGKPYAIFGISTDITDRKKAEESIRLAEANYREIFDKATDAIYVHEMETGKVIEVNQRASKITGYSKEELISTDPKEFITSHPEYTLQHAFNYLQKAAEGEPQLFEWLGKNKDGSFNWLEVNLKKASIAGQDRILAFFREINDRKKAQMEVQKLNEGLEQKVMDRTVELQSANKELESFSYSVSHDLRAPLRAIHGYTKMLSEDYFDKIDDNAKQMMNSVLRNAGKMGRLIDDLLAFSKLGKKDLKISTVDMTRLATTALNDLKYSLPSIKANIVILPLLPANADSNLMNQVFTNLISNAIKYSEVKDSPAIEIGSRQEGREAIYYVKDNGAGFDMKYYDKLFGVFQRLHRDEEFEGTGVGLALVKRIITRHGGKVWAEAETGKGATFYFSLNKTSNGS